MGKDAYNEQLTTNNDLPRLVFLVSGGGSNLQAVIDAIDNGLVKAQIAAVISTRRTAFALERAKKHGIPAKILRPRDFGDVDAYDEALCRELENWQPDLIVLGGYLSILGPQTISGFTGRIMNIHPSLLPAFGGKGYYGKHVHQRVIEHGVKISGATVMFVEGGVDTGPIILQEAVLVKQEDTPESLAERVIEVEHRLYPMAIKLFCEGRLRVNGRRVEIVGGEV